MLRLIRRVAIATAAASLTARGARSTEVASEWFAARNASSNRARHGSANRGALERAESSAPRLRTTRPCRVRWWSDRQPSTTQATAACSATRRRGRRQEPCRAGRDRKYGRENDRQLHVVDPFSSCVRRYRAG